MNKINLLKKPLGLNNPTTQFLGKNESQDLRPQTLPVTKSEPPVGFCVAK